MSVARPDTWMPMYWGDYAKDTAELSALEHGAYLMLIAHYWCKACPLPMDDSKLARIAKCTPAEWAKIKPSVLAFFEAGESVYRHKRVEHELASAKLRYERRSNARSNFKRNSPSKLGTNEATQSQSQSQYPSDIAREAREDFASQGWKAKTRDPFAPPEKRLREATLDEQELARRVRKVCGRMTCDADVAEWRKLDEARAA